MIEPHPASLSTSGTPSGFQQMTALLQVIVDGQTQLAETQQQLHSMVARIIAAIEAEATPPAPPTPKPAAPPKPTIATYEQMYGPIPTPAPMVMPVAPPSRRHWLVRWLIREAAR